VRKREMSTNVYKYDSWKPEFAPELQSKHNTIVSETKKNGLYGNLIIYDVHATTLDSSDKKRNPYVKVLLNDKVVWKSSVIHDNLNPSWLGVNVQIGSIHKNELFEVEVWDHELILGKFLGWCSFSATHIHVLQNESNNAHDVTLHFKLAPRIQTEAHPTGNLSLTLAWTDDPAASVPPPPTIAVTASHDEQNKEYTLVNAVHKGDSEKLEHVLKQGVDINCRVGHFGYTPLHYAAYYNVSSMLHFLHNRGAKLDIQDNLGQTPLMLAAVMDHRSIVEFLLHNGANKELKDGHGFTALQKAKARGAQHCISTLEK